MTVVSIGNIADTYSNGKLPKCGIIIQADKEELMGGVAGNLLYREVSIIDTTTAGEISHAESICQQFSEQVGRCSVLQLRLDTEPTRLYSREEVLAFFDELLDGIKPKKGKVKKCQRQ